MTWAEFMGARQLLAEEQVGSKMREYQRREDEVARRGIAALKRDQRGAR